MKLIFYVIYLKYRKEYEVDLLRDISDIYWKEYEVDLLRDISEIPERI